MCAHRNGTHLTESLRAELQMNKAEWVNVRIDEARRKKDGVIEEHEIDN